MVVHLNTLTAENLVDEKFGPNLYFGPNFSSTNFFVDQIFRQVMFQISKKMTFVLRETPTHS